MSPTVKTLREVSLTSPKLFRNTPKEDKKIKTQKNTHIKWSIMYGHIILLTTSNLCLVYRDHDAIMTNKISIGPLTMMRKGRFSSKRTSAKFETVIYPLKTETILSGLPVI